jgi:hypothetical protein
MTKNTKIVLGIIGGVLLLCICCGVGGFLLLGSAGRFVGDRMIIEEPEEVALKAREIVEYDLPPGFKEQGMADILIGKFLFIGEVDQNGLKSASGLVIAFFELPSNLDMDPEELHLRMELEWREKFRTQGWDLDKVSESPITVRGQDTELMLYEGFDENGDAVRQAVTTFDGKNGFIMLVIAGKIKDWDEAEIDHFINSIR